MISCKIGLKQVDIDYRIWYNE